MHGNTLAHFTSATKEYLEKIKFKNGRNMNFAAMLNPTGCKPHWRHLEHSQETRL